MLPPHGNNVAVAAMTTTLATRDLAAARLHGLGIAADALTIEIAAVVNTMVAIMTTVMARRHHHPEGGLLGNRLPHLPQLVRPMGDTVAMQHPVTAPVTLLSKQWALLLGLALRLVLHHPQALLLDSTRS